jgi:protein-disulfide isomerase
MNTDGKLVKLFAPVSERDHIRGSLDAPVVIVEYGDYECPYCGRAYWVIKELLEQLGGQIAFVFRNFPVTETHPRADAVAEALEAAGGQGRFWEMHDWFYEHQHQLEGLDLERHAGVIGLDVEQWRKELRERAYRERVHEDLETGRESGVTGTPTLFMNGVRYLGDYDFEAMVTAIQQMGAGIDPQAAVRQRRSQEDA